MTAIRVWGLAGNDNVAIAAGVSGSTADGGAGDDIIAGGTGNDILIDGAGSDTLSGGTGNDVYQFLTASAAEVDTVVELANQGIDRLDFSALASTTPVTVNLPSDTALATHTNRMERQCSTTQPLIV
jgi:serralysin